MRVQKAHFIKQKVKEYTKNIDENTKRLGNVPDTLMPKDVKEGYLKMKTNIMRRMVRNQAHNEALRKWKMPEIKQEIVKMSKMDQL